MVSENEDLFEKERMERFDQFFHPKSVAVIGASGRNDWFWLKNLVSMDFHGKIFPINPKYSSALGLTFYDKIANCPQDIDNAIIAVPSKRVYDVLKECILKNMKLGGIHIL